MWPFKCKLFSCNFLWSCWFCFQKFPTTKFLKGRYLFNIFLNDLEISYNNASAPFKYADDSTIVSLVSNQYDPSANLVGQFMTWSKENNMSCNQKKSKELIFRSKGNNSQYNPIFDISQCNSLVLLGVMIQSDCKFRAHVNLKLIKANKCLHVLRTLRKEQYSQAQIDYLFTSLVLPNFTSHVAAPVRVFSIGWENKRTNNTNKDPSLDNNAAATSRRPMALEACESCYTTEFYLWFTHIWSFCTWS